MASRAAGPIDPAIAAAIDDAKVVPIARAASPASEPPARNDAGDPGPPTNDQGGDGNRSGFVELIGEDCPVVPLGTSQGVYFYLSTLRELRVLKAKEHDGRNILSLFAPRTKELLRIFPRYGKNKLITGWDKEKAGEILVNACAEKGVWTAEGRVRGAGAHRDEDGGLVLHCGDMIQVPEKDVDELAFGSLRTWMSPGLIDRLVYPAAPKTPRPAVDYAGPEVGRELLKLLGTWNWERRDIDARLMLGWIAAALVCGALEWRPAAWITGGKGTGKSTLQKLIRFLMGENGLIDAVSATEAYIRQLLGHRTLPVALDELEADANNVKQNAIITLARLASSGGKMGKGGADHNPHEFTARSSFLFSSILTVPLPPQDKSRIAILDLRPLEDGDAPKMEAAYYNAMGRALRRRMVDQWPRLERVIESYRAELARNGHDARGQDQFGTLLGCSDVLLYDHDPDAEDEEYMRWGRALAVDRSAAAEEDEPFLVIQRLSTTALHGRGGDEPETLAMWIAKVISGGDEDRATRAQRRLEMSGVVVVASELLEQDGKPKRKTRRWNTCVPTAPNAVPIYVAVACSHQGLELLLRDTKWQGGVWNQALGRLPGAIKRIKVQMGGRPEWATLVPIAAFASTLPDDQVVDA
ncbi:hypothetical protein [Sphingomonas sp. KC8]|uniref:hypothetical protein n=1 Tax=Sphingomonas sp. KC8 TaxID=1030157 RepID=UPI000248A429|nr:hypothetical protein [Sphingomonas sp. KC8]ARS27626.1 hypothetical protein KC8_10010 [Sphingomonas sp. KC8]